MSKKIKITNPENVDISALCAHGFYSYNVIRLVDNRPSLIYLWFNSDNGIVFSAKSHDISDRIEVGLIGVARANKNMLLNKPGSEEILPDVFLSPTSVFMMRTKIGETAIDSGIYFLTKAGGEIQIMSGNYPHTLSFKIFKRSKDYEPEFLAPDYQYIELKG